MKDKSMDPLLWKIGLGCIVVAIVGGGLEFAGTKIPFVGSTVRQLLLAGFGTILICVYVAAQHNFSSTILPGRVSYDITKSDSHPDCEDPENTGMLSENFPASSTRCSWWKTTAYPKIKNGKSAFSLTA